MKKEKSCGSVVVDEGKVLLVHHNLGHWDFPKGHVEAFETEEETAIREVKEETNIDIEVDSSKKCTITYSPKEGVTKDVVFFLGRPLNKDTKPQETEVCEAKFVEIKKAFDLLTYDNAKEVLKKLAL